MQNISGISYSKRFEIRFDKIAKTQKNTKERKFKKRNTRKSVRESEERILANTAFIQQKNAKNFSKSSCIKFPDVIYYRGLCKAMKWEVTLL